MDLGTSLISHTIYRQVPWATRLECSLFIRYVMRRKKSILTQQTYGVLQQSQQSKNIT